MKRRRPAVGGADRQGAADSPTNGREADGRHAQILIFSIDDMSKDKKTGFKNIQIVNRKATHEYSFVQQYNAGIMLTGTEVKAIRTGNANLTDAYCTFQDGELMLRNMHISEYSFGSYMNHETRRVRKLLLRRAELDKLFRRVSEKGFTVVPYRIFFSDRGLIKLEIALAQGKKSFDKRETLKERDNKRELDQLRKIKL